MREFFRHRASRVLIACMLVQGAVIGVASNCFGVYVVAIRQSMGFSTTTFSAYYTLRTLGVALFLPLLSKLVYRRFPKWNRFFVIGLGLLNLAALCLGAFSTRPEAWYGIGVLAGLGCAIFNVNHAYVISAWFRKRRNFFVGLAGASSGVVGLVMNPVTSALVERFGWRTALLLLCALGAAMVLAGGLQLRLTPEEVGLKPYGDEEEAAQPVARAAEKDDVLYGRRGQLLVGAAVMLSFGSAMIVAMNISHLPNYAAELRYSLSIGALFSSFVMAGNILGKVFLGTLCDRFSLPAVVLACFAAQTLALFLLAFARGNLALLLCCSALAGLAQSVVNVLMHTVVRYLYGVKRYMRLFSSLYAAATLITAPMSLLVGVSVDHTGSYQTCLTVIAALYALSTLGLGAAFAARKSAVTVGEQA